MSNYVVYHLHSDLSNAVTNIDSVTQYGDYIKAAQQCGMTAMAFSEHGSVMQWWQKKCEIEKAGMKYIHAVECYLTESLAERVRDNYHCVLIAKNYDGFLEINRLISQSFNRDDGHFYYVPRITFRELFQTSCNIIVTTACIGGVLGKGEQETQDKFIRFLDTNKLRCFLEIGHHIDEKQKMHNRRLLTLSEMINVPLIAGTDTHVLDERHEKGRSILQASKDIHFDGEANWDLKFKTYDELVEAYKIQNCLPMDVNLEAIENTNRLADMIEPFELDQGTKYPHIYKDPEKIFTEKVMSAIDTHPYALKNHTREELVQTVNEELEVYKKTKSIDFMLLQTYLREWEKDNDIQCGYGRGSVSGSMIAYLLGITQMDSMKFGLNFFRFMNPSRVTNADIDTDYSGNDRERIKQFLLKDKMNLQSIKSAEIITFNTIALKGAVRDVCKALYKGSEDVNYLKLSSQINKLAEQDEYKARDQYPEVFEYVDIINGTIVSVGTHPSGVLISDLPIEETIGMCSLKSTPYPVSMLDMKELDALMYVKLDILGLDNIGVINETCKMAGIDRLTPDNVDLDDENVWKSIRDNTTLIFQWESNSAQQYIKRFMSDKTLQIAKQRVPNFSMIKWLSFGNGLLRPACASFRDSVADGEFYDNGLEILNEFLAPEAGRIAMQETIMQFLVKFCGYSAAESDNVRRAIAKKKGTETLLPEIEERFIQFIVENYEMKKEEAEAVIKPFLQVILDASAYAFSWNHSDAYSCIGYISGYLRYYYPYEFLTAALNIFSDNTEKTAAIIKYAKRNNIIVTSPKWGVSTAEYAFDKERKIITKGMSSIKYLSSNVAQELYDLALNCYKTRDRFDHFVQILKAIDDKTTINARQLEILIKLDFFSEFGNQRELLTIYDVFSKMFKYGQVKQLARSMIDGSPFEPFVREHATWTTKKGEEAKSYTITDAMPILVKIEEHIKSSHMDDLEDRIKIRNFQDYMGYIGYVSGREEDQKKLYIIDIYPLRRKSDNKQFGYSIITKSIGSGKESRFTVYNKEYNREPITKDDIILLKGWKRNGQYFTLLSYEKEL